MKKTMKTVVSVILCIMMLFCSVTGASAAEVSADTASYKTTMMTELADKLTSYFNLAVEGLLEYLCGLLPDSVLVQKLNDYKVDNFYSGDDTFIDNAKDGASWSLGYSEGSIVPSDFYSGAYYKGGYALNVKLTEIRDDLKVRVTVLDDGSGRGAVVFAVVDCIGLANADVKLIREALSDFAAENNIKSINVSATHTHSGIDTQGVYTDLFTKIGKNLVASFLGSDNLEPAISTAFLNTIVNQTAACVKQAYSSMTKGILTYAVKNVEEYVRDRTDPDVSIDNMYRFEFSPDNGSRKTIIASFGVHPEGMGIAGDSASSDFVYYTEKVLNAAGYNFMFIQGAVGTITENCHLSDDGIDHTRAESVIRYGEEIGYMLLGMTCTEAECKAEIVDIARENLADGSEDYTPWYENWTPVEETEVEPILNIKLETYLVPIDNMVYAALGKVSLADNVLVKDDDGNYYTPTEIGFMEIGKDVKVVLCPGETYAELIKGGSNMGSFEYGNLYDHFNTENVLVFDLMNDAAGYIMPDSYFSYANVKYSESEGLHLADSWGLTSMGRHAASHIYGEFYALADSVR